MLNPTEMLKQLDRYVVGQEQAKTCLVLAIRERWRTAQLKVSDRALINNTNVLLKGPTGCGKTLTVSTAANLFGLPIYITPVTRFTQVGYYGEDTKTIINEFIGQNKTKPLPDWYVKELKAKRAKRAASLNKHKARITANAKTKVRDLGTSELVKLYKLAPVPTKRKITKVLVKFKNELHSTEIPDNKFITKFPTLITDKNLERTFNILSFCDTGVKASLTKEVDKSALVLTLRKILSELLLNHGNAFNYRIAYEIVTGKKVVVDDPYIEDLINRFYELSKTKRDKFYKLIDRASYELLGKYVPMTEIMAILEAELPVMNLSQTVNTHNLGLITTPLENLFEGFGVLANKGNVSKPVPIGGVLEAFLITLSSSLSMEELNVGVALYEEGMRSSEVSAVNKEFVPTKRETKDYLEQYGVIFLDEIDKLADTRGDNVGGFGVQRELLTMLEGQFFDTDLGRINTKNILFVTAGAFASVKESDLMPELLGRLAIRGELKPLTAKDLTRVVNNSVNGFLWQTSIKLKTEGVDLTFEDGVGELIARYTHAWNLIKENYGARRLSDVLNKVITPISLIAHTLKGTKHVITKDEVESNLEEDRRQLKVLTDLAGISVDDLLSGKIADAEVLAKKVKTMLAKGEATKNKRAAHAHK